VLAGGSARRFGSPKGLALLGDTQVVELVMNRVRAQSTGPIILNAEPAGPYTNLDNIVAVVPDRLTGPIGALAGIHAALEWSANLGLDQIATVAIDTPFLPLDLLSRLNEPGGAAISASKGQWHPLCGLWPSELAGSLAKFIASGRRAAHDWAEHCGANVVDFSSTDERFDPFFNINTPNDLSHAASFLRDP